MQAPIGPSALTVDLVLGSDPLSLRSKNGTWSVTTMPRRDPARASNVAKLRDLPYGIWPPPDWHEGQSPVSRPGRSAACTRWGRGLRGLAGRINIEPGHALATTMIER